MTVELAFHPAAEEEVLAAQDWYAERSSEAARAFFHEVGVVVDRVVAAPGRWPAYVHGTRRIVFPRFPFVMIYRVRDQAVQVVAVAHQSRRPRYWRDRL